MSTQAVILTQDELQALCPEWQGILRLRDWQVVVRVKRGCDLAGEERCGEVRWVVERRQALIYILDSVDYPPEAILPQDMEHTLVHELLHLHFVLIRPKDDTTEDKVHEQALHAIADGYITLKRRAGR